MKKLATITGENGNRITLSYDGTHIIMEEFGEPAIESGPYLATEEAAAEYIQDSWGRNWDLTWAEVSR